MAFIVTEFAFAANRTATFDGYLVFVFQNGYKAESWIFTTICCGFCSSKTTTYGGIFIPENSFAILIAVFYVLRSQGRTVFRVAGFATLDSQKVRPWNHYLLLWLSLIIVTKNTAVPSALMKLRCIFFIGYCPYFALCLCFCIHWRKVGVNA